MIFDQVSVLGSGVDGAIREVGYSYDSAGQLEFITSYDAANGGNIVNQVQRVYDGLGQLVAEYQEHDGAVNTSTTPKVAYAYSDLEHGSRLVSMSYPDGRVLNYRYGTSNSLNDRIGRLEALVDEDGTTTLEAYEYLGFGTVVERSHPQSGADLTYIGTPSGDGGDQYTGLDRFGRILQQTWTDGTSSLDQYTYSYDRSGNRLSRDNLLNSSLNEAYSYDNLNRLVTFGRADGHEQDWDLDALGNWDAITTDNITENRTHNSQNQLTAIGSTGLTYDANGNTTTDENGNTLVYDAWNRLVEAKDGSTSLIRYEHDGLNRRIEEGNIDVYYTSNWQVIEERNASGAVTTQHVWSPVYVDAMVLRDRDTDANGSLDERLYVMQDANFNVTAIVNLSGQVLERYTYLPYGDRMILNADWSTDTDGISGYAFQHGHQGGKLDLTTGLYHFRNREYSPVLGRWMQQDLMGYVDGMSLYGVQTQNPINGLDPSGLQTLGAKFTQVLLWRIGRAGSSIGFALNRLGSDLYWFDDDENEMTSLVSVYISKYYRHIAQRYASEITSEWKEFTIYRESAQARVGAFNTGSQGPFASTDYFLGGAHDVFASGTLKLRCSNGNIRMKDLNIKWEWRDQIDANSFIQGWNNGSGAKKWLVEGLWDMGPEKVASVDYNIWVTWYDKRYNDRPEGVPVAAAQ